jgi:hypothetical protein
MIADRQSCEDRQYSGKNASEDVDNIVAATHRPRRDHRDIPMNVSGRIKVSGQKAHM